MKFSQENIAHINYNTLMMFKRYEYINKSLSTHCIEVDAENESAIEELSADFANTFINSLGKEYTALLLEKVIEKCFEQIVKDDAQFKTRFSSKLISKLIRKEHCILIDNYKTDYKVDNEIILSDKDFDKLLEMENEGPNEEMKKLIKEVNNDSSQ
jgi:hypothetical protein